MKISLLAVRKLSVSLILPSSSLYLGLSCRRYFLPPLPQLISASAAASLVCVVGGDCCADGVRGASLSPRRSLGVPVREIGELAVTVIAAYVKCRERRH